jgi:hypothetical protein
MYKHLHDDLLGKFPSNRHPSIDSLGGLGSRGSETPTTDLVFVLPKGPCPSSFVFDVFLVIFWTKSMMHQVLTSIFQFEIEPQVDRSATMPSSSIYSRACRTDNLTRTNILMVC